MKKISIIVPIYNVYDYLERILNCLVNQTYKNLEIILVDDGSTDQSGVLCEEYQRTDNRIKVIHQKNSGVSVARNVGLKHATGHYIAFIDSDDYISLNMMEILVNNLITKDADVSVCNYLTFSHEIPTFNTNNNTVETFTSIEILKDIISDGKITNFLWNKLFKKELFTNITFPKGKIYEDLYVLPKIFEKTTTVCYTKCQLYGYYQRPNSYVNTYNLEKNNNYLDFANECYQYLFKYKELRKTLESYRCFYIYSAFLQAAKSHCKEIINSPRMSKELSIFRHNFKLEHNISLKRRLLYYLLYINKILFYKVVTLIK